MQIFSNFWSALKSNQCGSTTLQETICIAKLTDVLSPEQNQSQDSLLLSLGRLGGLRLQLAELLAIPEDHVHVLIESFELSDEGARILMEER
jgi:hypothetical protein